jgi:hypothetical protein
MRHRNRPFVASSGKHPILQIKGHSTSPGILGVPCQEPFVVVELQVLVKKEEDLILLTQQDGFRRKATGQHELLKKLFVDHQGSKLPMQPQIQPSNFGSKTALSLAGFPNKSSTRR